MTMPFEKKGDRIDIHIWLSEHHVAILDRICREYELSRAKVVSGLLEDYDHKEKTNEPLPRHDD